MRLLISGSSGFIGGALCAYLRAQGHELVLLQRTKRPSQDQTILWTDDLLAFENFDGVIHLSGEKLSIGRWSQKKKEAIFQSRVQYTSQLVSILLRLKRPPSVFISASAVGIYGDRQEELLDETSSIGTGFLADVCKAWEVASRPLAEKGIRTVQTRFGMVLGPEGGALLQLRSLYRWGLGAVIGSGLQWMSWVSRNDLIRSIDWILTHPLQGPVNVVSPQSVRQKDFAKALGKAVHRPVLWKIPAWMIRLGLKEMGEEILLASAHVVPSKLSASGFVFESPSLEQTLTEIVSTQS